MNVFYIPSWYPSRRSHGGIFFLEWADAIQELSDANLAICRFGNIEIRLRHPLQTLTDCMTEFLGSGYKSSEVIPEFKSLVVKYSHRFGFPDRAFVEAGKKNFRSAERRIGKIDLIHAQVSYPAGFVAMHLAEEFNIPFVITEVMGPFPFPIFLEGNSLAPRIRDPLTRAAAVMAISPALKDRMNGFGIPGVTSVPGFVDERVFYPAEKPARESIFFALSNLSVEKGTDDLLAGIQYLVHEMKRSDIKVRIGGPGDLAHYRRKAKDLKIEGKVTFLGALTREEAAEQFRAAMAFILPSRHETFGMVYVEALACGLPVIAARAGGPESIVEETNGILVPVGGVIEIAQAMAKIADERACFDSQAIRAGFMKRFSRDAVVGRIRRIYADTIAAKPKGTELCAG